MTFDHYITSLAEWLPEGTITALYAELFGIWSAYGSAGSLYCPFKVAVALAENRGLPVLEAVGV